MLRFTRNILSIIFLAFSLNACGAIDERAVQTGSIFLERSGKTNVLIGLKGENLNSLGVLLGAKTSYELQFLKYDPTDGLTHKAKWGEIDFARAAYGINEFDNLTDVKYVAIPVEAGAYALDRLIVRDRGNHGWLIFTTDHRKTEFTPSFEIQANQVVYVGDFTVIRLDGNTLSGSPTRTRFALRYDGHSTDARDFARQKGLSLQTFSEIGFPLLKSNPLHFGRARQ
jgi:hypothetical protein